MYLVMCRHARRKFGLLEKHKDYVERARAFHKKEETLQVSWKMNLVMIWFSLCWNCLLYVPCRNLGKRRRSKIRMSSTSRWSSQKLWAESTGMRKFRKAYLIHRWFMVIVDFWVWFIEWWRGEPNKYTSEELMLMKTQDIGYIFQKLQSEKKVVILLEVFAFELIEVLCIGLMFEHCLFWCRKLKSWMLYCILSTTPHQANTYTMLTTG